MPDRTKEDYKKILKDMKAIQKLIDEDISKQDYYFITSKKHFREHDKKQMLKLSNLLKICTSCEGVGFINHSLQLQKNAVETANYLHDFNYYNSKEYHPFDFNKTFSFSDMVTILERAIQGKASGIYINRLNRALNFLEGQSGCIPRAFNKSLLEEATRLAFDPDNITLENTEKGGFIPDRSRDFTI
jgi:hypothetical protein